jgi:hypothetical protein
MVDTTVTEVMMGPGETRGGGSGMNSALRSMDRRYPEARTAMVSATGSWAAEC